MSSKWNDNIQGDNAGNVQLSGWERATVEDKQAHDAGQDETPVEHVCPIDGVRHVHDGQKWVKVVD